QSYGKLFANSLFALRSSLFAISCYLPSCEKRKANSGKRNSVPGNIRLVETGKLLLQVRHLGQIVVPDVKVVGMQRRIVLVISLRRIERLEGNHLRHDRARKSLGLVELSNVGLRDALLVGAVVKNRRAILRALVRSLAVQLRGIVRHGEVHFQELPVGDLRGIVNNLHGFSMAGLAAADDLIFGGVGRASRVARRSADDAFNVLKNSLHSPETAAGENHRFLAAL